MKQFSNLEINIRNFYETKTSFFFLQETVAKSRFYVIFSSQFFFPEEIVTKSPFSVKLILLDWK